jgi:hypothetical protein
MGITTYCVFGPMLKPHDRSRALTMFLGCGEPRPLPTNYPATQDSNQKLRNVTVAGRRAKKETDRLIMF